MLLKSPFKEMVIPEVAVHQAMLAAMSNFKERTALINGVTDERFTYGRIIDCSRRLASALFRLGLRKGDILSIYCYNAPEYILMFLATWANGASITVTNPSYTEHELLHHLEDSQAKWLFTAKDLLPKVSNACKKYRNLKRTITLDAAEGCVSIGDLLQDDGSLYPTDVEINAKEDVALIPYSSGTTGLPKGVMLTHYNLVANLMQMGSEDVREPPEEGALQPIMLNVLPMFHMYAIEGLLIAGLISGATIVSLPRFDPHVFLSAIEKYKVNYLPMVPPLVVFLAKSPLTDQYDLSSVQRSLSGAAPLKASTAAAFIKKLKLKEDFGNGYGMTETTCASSLAGRRPQKPGSVGYMLPNMEAKIVDPESGRMLGQGETGELCMRGPNIMKGYHNRPEATKKALDADGFLHSGDIAYFDDEGCIFIVDRIKELIKYKGFQVAPAELEALLLSHPDVDDVGVIGIPDEEAGEVPRAYIVKRPGCSVSASQLNDFVNERVANFKRLRGGLVFTKQIPKTPTGKIMRRALAEEYKRHQSKL